MDALTLITRWELSHTMLAERIGMPRSTFAKKISPNLPGYAFTKPELERIKRTLISLSKDLSR